MTEVSRRGVVKYAAALAVGAGMTATGSALGDEPKKPAAAPQGAKVADELLARAMKNPESFMLSEATIFALDVDGHSRDLYITSALDQNGKSKRVRVPSRSIRIFRADPNVDEFTKQGGLQWRFRDKPGKVQLKKSASGLGLAGTHSGWGEIVMVVRDEDTVRCYTMTPDERC